MTTPISNSSSVYDPSTHVSRLDECDSSNSSCAVSGAAAEPAQRHVVTLEPVYVHGDASTQQLVEQYDQKRSSSCFREGLSAAATCGGAAAATVGTAAAVVTVVLGAAGVAMSFAAGVTCGKDLRAWSDCNAGR